MTTQPRRDVGTRIAEALSSQSLNALIGIVGIALPVVAWAMQRKGLTNILLAAVTILLLLVIANHMWLRRIYIQLRRANDRDMADARYFALIALSWRGT
jgi:multisubunit Na+/H+ antiporter MnhG subunit